MEPAAAPPGRRPGRWHLSATCWKMTQKLNNSITDRGCIHRYESPPGLEWDAVVRQSAHAHLGGAPQWFTVIGQAYGHQPVYLRGEDGEGNPAVLPAFFIRRRLLGTVMASMPFLDAGGPCGTPPLTGGLIDCLTAEARTLQAGRLELRCTRPVELPVRPFLEKVSLVLPLPPDPDRLWRGLDPKVRNQTRKAERSGLSVEVGGLEYLDAFYQVFATNMRDLGSPVHGKTFFRAILESFGQAARVVLVRKDTVPVGGLLSVQFKDTVFVPWASSLRAYASLCPNMLLYWESLRRACKDGFARFDFGRSTRGSGTYRFKRQWGAAEVQLYWYSVPIGGRSVAHVSGNESAWTLLSQIWQRLPLSVSLVLGPRIRRYLTQ